MRSVPLVLVLLAAGVAGCLGGGGPTDAPSSDPDTAPDRALNLGNATVAMSECSSSRGVECFEPSIAVDGGGRIFATNTPCEALARSTDGGDTFEEVDVPPLPPEAPPEPRRGDCTLQVGDDGRVYFHALVAPETNLLADQRLAGIQVAASADGGDTWETNTWVHPASRDANRNFNTDRQWLTFAGEGRVYLTYWQVATRGQLPDAYIATSDNAGDSFGPFREMPGIIPGNPVSTGEDTLHAPWFTFTEDYIVRFSTTTDAGDSFEMNTVHEGEGDHQGAYPAIDAHRDSLYLAWIEEEGQVLASRGTPEAGFSHPLVLNEVTANATIDAAPDIRVHDGLVDVAWYRSTEDGQRYVLARLPVEGFGNETPAIHPVGRVNASEPVTDFATFDVTDDGRAVFAWTDPGDGLEVARELPAS